ncbi:hypothetical protein JTB14_010923 [Gonioctena quinquepunctata]|nr:hypothetical protein JTB14_010923 [Gonioctena quinquepunctata]
METFKTPVRNKKIQDLVHIPASPFMKKIGLGTGIAVYEMKRSPVANQVRSPWAVKKLIKHSEQNEFTKCWDTRLQKEAEILRKLDHPNIVGFRAFSKDHDGTGILAMEECSSSLGDMIENRLDYLGEVPYPADIILKVSADVSKALNYLHNEVLLFHGDIKSFNVLVQGDFLICKLCDFGVCLPLTKSGEIDSNKVDEESDYNGTTAWNAPELLKYPQEITAKADMYAFGLVIWEMIALSIPVDDNLMSCSVQSSSGEDNVVIERERPPLPYVELGTEYNFVLEIYFCCTARHMDERPGAADLLMCFEEYYKERNG